MATAELRAELLCSICMEIYKDPVTLACGHSYCRDCITKTFDHQEEDELRCPECQHRFRRRPDLVRNHRLHSMAEASTQPDHEETGIFCTFCDLSVPADKSCLQCETSMCGKHLIRHNKTALKHTLLPPRTDLKKRKCPIHQKILEFYCKEDSACICVSCRLDGDHMGHKVEPLDEAAENKKENLKSTLGILRSVQEKRGEKIQSLQERKTNVHRTSATMSKRVTDQFQTVRDKINIIEQRILSKILKQEKMMLKSTIHQIQQLEKQNNDLSKRIQDIEDLIRMTDPLTVIQDKELEKGIDLRNINICEEDTKRVIICPIEDLKTGANIKSLLEVISNILTSVEKGIYLYEPIHVTLDETTAGNNLHISGDLHTAHVTKQNYTETLGRFEYPQVLSIETFSFGKYYWEVGTSDLGEWRVGVCYSSIATRGPESLIGENDKSWCLRRYDNKIYARHNSKGILIPYRTSCKKLRICLAYYEGTLSFYELSDTTRHLHTFTANFNDTLHAAFGFLALSGRHGWVKTLQI